jgi:hypothetical protein
MTTIPLFPHLLDTEIDKAFTRLCADAEPSLLPLLVKDVEQHVLQVRIALSANEFLDIGMAERIAKLLINLLGRIESYPQPKQKLIVGASRYLVQPQSVVGN